MKNTYKLCFAVIASMLFTTSKAQSILGFDSLLKTPNSYLNGSGSNVQSSFLTGNVNLPNTYITAYGGIWSKGWAYSNIQNDTTLGYKNLYAAYANTANSGANYGVGQNGSVLRISGADKGQPVKGVYITNGTYAALSMKDGDAFAKKFGGVSGNDSDYFSLSVKAYYNNMLSNNTVEFYLADYRNSDNNQDYIVKDWAWVDLTSLGNADSLVFYLSSSDNGQFGMNTPAFFCIDDIITNSDTADFEELNLWSGNSFWNKKDTTLKSAFADSSFAARASFGNEYAVSGWGDYWQSGFAMSTMTDTTTAGFGNMYSSYAGNGYNSLTYAVAQQNAQIIFDNMPVLTKKSSGIQGMYISNTTYTALSMKNGDAFAKKFGGVSGNDSDWFMVSFIGFTNNGLVIDTVSAYLADFRSSDNTQDYIVKNWKWIDLSKISYADTIKIVLSSSDTGQYGMNTPAFVAIDNIIVDFGGGLTEKGSELNASVYPNPTNGKISIDIAENNARVNIYDITGNLILSDLITSNSQSFSIESAPSGVYFAHIVSQNGTVVKKVIKQ